MPKQIRHPGGAIEYIDTPEEEKSKKKHKGKKPEDLTPKEKDELLWAIAKKLNLI